MQRPLADGKLRLGGDADELRALHVELVAMGGLHLLERGPLLPAGGHVLPLILADGAVLRRQRGVGLLHATGGANKFHVREIKSVSGGEQRER